MEGLLLGPVKKKNFNSFVARLMTSDDQLKATSYPIWKLREALEQEPCENGPKMESEVWMAADWIVYGKKLIFDLMKEGHEEDRAYRTGPLCENIPQFSMERWSFWKKRFSELAASGDDVGIGAACIERIAEALKCMDTAET